MTTSPSRASAFSVRFSLAEAELMLSALSHAVSYVLEERSLGDRRAAEAMAERIGALRARLLRLVAVRGIHAPDPEEERLQHA